MSLRVLMLCLVFGFPALAQEEPVWLHPNAGQWDPRIDYSVELHQGSMMICSEGFIYFLNDAQTHDDSAHGHHRKDTVHAQVVRSVFRNVSWKGIKRKGGKSGFYRNYFTGNDPARWKSNVYSTDETTYENYYDGIDLNISGKAAGVKYSFIVSPGADVSVIASEIQGADKVYLKNGALHIAHRFGEITETQPVAWTTAADGTVTKVAVKFVLEGNTVSYDFPRGYDESATLTIDPNIVFSTFTGSTRDNWGMTATPDQSGNLYAGGIVFAGGTGTYPVTTGAFDVSFAGGTSYTYSYMGNTYSMQGFDVAISKFNATGTAMIYSTYLGGSGNESVHSLVTDEQNHLYILGVTSSSDFPVTSGCIDASFNGGPAISTNELGFPQGADMYISHLDASGGSMVGSTFFGGTGTDGINSGNLYYNYGDPFRGEIIVKDGFVYVASSTSSTNITLVNPFQSTLNGSQNAVVLKANAALTTLSWSTYIGGNGYNSGNGIQISSTGNIYVTGGATGTMPFSAGHTLSNNGGSADAYVMRLANATGAVIAGTFMGTAAYDQSFFVQLDNSDNVYIYGQSSGSIPVSPGKYGVSNSGQFVAKYNSMLTNRLWTTSVGAGSGHVEISPTAFLVSNCGEIYLAGWGGQVNQNNAPGATQSSTSGFPVTSDAYKTTTTGSNFWIAVLGRDAISLKYATFMGGSNANQASDHVDGGTSRFDKNGNIYHAVCAACGSYDNGFPTTPGVYSPQNPSPNCNLAAFKFELSTIDANVAQPSAVICIPDPVVFSNTSENGNTYHWDFGDNTTSGLASPSHAYSQAGSYTVTLIVSDSANCFTSDTVVLQVNIGDFGGGIIAPPDNVCPNVPFQFEAYGGISYKWSPAQYLNNPNIYNPIAVVSETTTFSCIISDSCGIDTVSVVLHIFDTGMQASNDTTICIGNSVPLFASGAQDYQWTPATYLDDPSSQTPVSTPSQTITYVVAGTTSDGCQVSDTVRIEVEVNPPVPEIGDSLRYCSGESRQVQVSGATSYEWSPNIDITPVNSSFVTISTQTDRYYYCDFTNTCATVRDSIFVDVIELQISAGNDTIVCPENPFFMWASGAVNYYWSPLVSYLDENGSQVTSAVDSTTTFTVTGVDVYGCQAQATVLVAAYPKPQVTAGPDVYAFIGDQVLLSAVTSSPGSVSWSPTEFLSCVNCNQTVAVPDQNYQYTVSFTDANGCTDSDNVKLFYDPIIYVPNAFTPDGNEYNGIFLAQGGNISKFRMEIFDRWGELIFTSTSMRDGWDGTYNGKRCQDGVYTWKIRYSDYYDKEYEKVGHVTLLR